MRVPHICPVLADVGLFTNPKSAIDNRQSAMNLSCVHRHISTLAVRETIPPMSLQLVLFIVVVIFVVGWFALGTHYNVRKGEDALRWLQEGLPLAGEKTTMQWLGSSVVQLKIQHARPPFRDAEILVVLEPRDVAPLWGIARLRHRRDLFVFRGALQKRPRLELEAHDPRSWTLAAGEKYDGWVPVTAPAGLVARAPQQQRPTSETLEGCPLLRLTVRFNEPNLEVQWRLDDIRKRPAREVLQAVRRVAESL
jgi:hypothetical protein